MDIKVEDLHSKKQSSHGKIMIPTLKTQFNEVQSVMKSNDKRKYILQATTTAKE